MRKPTLVFIGPSGSGKSTIARKLVQNEIVVLTPTWTTRSKREDERAFSEHEFVSEKEFDEALSKGLFQLTLQPFDLPYRYGLPKLINKPGKISMIMLRAVLINDYRKIDPNCIVYNFYSSKEKATSRIELRSSEDEDIGTRLDVYDSEVEESKKVADRNFVNNGTVESLYKKVLDCLLSDTN